MEAKTNIKIYIPIQTKVIYHPQTNLGYCLDIGLNFNWASSNHHVQSDRKPSCHSNTKAIMVVLFVAVIIPKSESNTHTAAKEPTKGSNSRVNDCVFDKPVIPRNTKSKIITSSIEICCKNQRYIIKFESNGSSTISTYTTTTLDTNSPGKGATNTDYHQECCNDKNLLVHIKPPTLNVLFSIRQIK